MGSGISIPSTDLRVAPSGDERKATRATPSAKERTGTRREAPELVGASVGFSVGRPWEDMLWDVGVVVVVWGSEICVVYIWKLGR